MAICVICGAVDGSKPEHWQNWPCLLCFRDDFRTYESNQVQDFDDFETPRNPADAERPGIEG